MDETALLRKLAAIEALHEGATTDGERDAAAAARERIRARLAALGVAAPAVERQYRLYNDWSVKLFVALARRYGLTPYRRPRQRRHTVMLRAPAQFLDGTFWPAYLAIEPVLLAMLDAAAERAIASAVHRGGGEVEVVEQGLLPAPGGG